MYWCADGLHIDSVGGRAVRVQVRCWATAAQLAPPLRCAPACRRGSVAVPVDYFAFAHAPRQRLARQLELAAQGESPGGGTPKEAASSSGPQHGGEGQQHAQQVLEGAISISMPAAELEVSFGAQLRKLLANGLYIVLTLGLSGLYFVVTGASPGCQHVPFAVL